MRKKLYFGHPPELFGTKLERTLIERIEGHPAFIEYNIVNLGDPLYHDRAVGYEMAVPGNNGRAYLLAVVRTCAAGIFFVYNDLKWDSDLFDEAVELRKKRAPLWHIFADECVWKISKLNSSHRLTAEESSGRRKTLRSVLK